jgi:hypothetical protein
MCLKFKAATEEPEVATVAPEPKVEPVAHALSDFEGIVDAPLGDWFASCPLTCGVCNYQVCDLPELAELEVPASFYQIARSSIDIILYHSKVHGDRIDSNWISGILTDCRSRSIRSERVKEPLLLRQHIFLGLAGLPLDSLDTLKAVIRRPEEFANLSPEVRESKAFCDSISGLIGSDGLAEMFIYHTIRDNLNYLQVRLGISSLEPRSGLAESGRERSVATAGDRK